jgi:hypothetical protein
MSRIGYTSGSFRRVFTIIDFQGDECVPYGATHEVMLGAGEGFEALISLMQKEVAAFWAPCPSDEEGGLH